MNKWELTRYLIDAKENVWIAYCLSRLMVNELRYIVLEK